MISRRQLFVVAIVVTLLLASCQEPVAAWPSFGGFTWPGKQAAPSMEDGSFVGLQYTTERLRALKFKYPVKCQKMTMDQAAKYVTQANAKEISEVTQDSRDNFYRALGLLAKAESTANYLDGMMAEQVRGAYDPAKKVLILVDGATSGVQIDQTAQKLLSAFGVDLDSIYTIHELEHALQDQHFDLDGAYTKRHGRLDAELAIQCIAEGDAVKVMLSALAEKIGLSETSMEEYAFGSPDLLNQGISRYPQLANAPKIVRDLLIRPYFDGLQFVSMLSNNGGWQAVNKAFISMPDSTEQILHPALFSNNRPRPVVVDLSAMPREIAGYTNSVEDTAGELLVRIWAQSVLSNDSKAKLAAAGWGGDTWRVYAKERERFVVWATTWDTETDAEEFVELAKNAGAKLALDCLVERNGQQVVLAFNIPAAQRRNVMKAAWKLRV